MVTKEGGIKCSRYFAFVKKILERKSEKRAQQRKEEQESITPVSVPESQSQVNYFAIYLKFMVYFFGMPFLILIIIIIFFLPAVQSEAGRRWGLYERECSSPEAARRRLDERQ